MLREFKTHNLKKEDIVVTDTEDDYASFKVPKKQTKEKKKV